MTNRKQIRAVLPLLKAPITDITNRGFKISLGAYYGAPTTIDIPCDTSRYDLHEGDVVSLYTEVFLKPGVGNA